MLIVNKKLYSQNVSQCTKCQRKLNCNCISPFSTYALAVCTRLLDVQSHPKRTILLYSLELVILWMYFVSELIVNELRKSWKLGMWTSDAFYILYSKCIYNLYLDYFVIHSLNEFSVLFRSSLSAQRISSYLQCLVCAIFRAKVEWIVYRILS